MHKTQFISINTLYISKGISTVQGDRWSKVNPNSLWPSMPRILTRISTGNPINPLLTYYIKNATKITSILITQPALSKKIQSCTHRYCYYTGSYLLVNQMTK